MVYGYVRVSTDRQVEEGESLGAQQRALQGYAMMQGLTIDRIFVESGVSGSKPLIERPQGAKLLEIVKAGARVLTPKLDRMFRSALNALDVLAKLQKAGVFLHMLDLGGDVTGNGISKLVFTILSAVAEAERDRIRERIRDVKKDQRSRNRYLGGTVPFGWRRGEDGALIKDRRQQAAIERMRQMRGGGEPLRRIAEKLQGEGFTITHAGVRKLLQTPAG
jgi:putative DNA-invertase from lambdoid prophage Rac